MNLSESLENLKGFDVNDLDFQNMGSWPGPVKIIVLLIILSAVIGGGYWYIIEDQYIALDQVEQKETELRQQYAVKASKVANLDALRAQMREMEETLGALLKQLPTDTEVPGLLEDITNTALNSGLQISSIDLKAESSKQFYAELPIDVSVSGTYHDLASFVSQVASLPRIVTLHDFSIKPQKGSEQLSMRVLAKTYRYDATGGKKKSNKKRSKKK